MVRSLGPGRGAEPAGNLSAHLLTCLAAEEEEDLQQLAVAVFRALLRVLPASTRTWFGSLRDRSTASLVEVSLSSAAS